MLDIGTHIIADQGLATPASYEQVVPELGRAGIVPAELVERMAGIAGLRNILVHDYLDVDHGRLYDDLTSGLVDFEDFATSVTAFMSSQP